MSAFRIPEVVLTADLPVGEDYVAPADRPAEWARMAGELLASGYSEAQVAQSLAVDAETIQRIVEGQPR